MVDTTTVTPLEVNAMLEALSSHNKVKAAVQLFRDHLSVNGQVDQYSVGILLQALTNSIQDNQQPNYEIDRIRNKHLRTILASPCWQWKEAIKLLDECFSKITLNNPIFSNLLRLNERASQVFASEHPGHALACLQIMRDFDIVPDEVTCTMVLGASHSWRLSLQLFQSMQQQLSNDVNASKTWRLPRPNVYGYSAVITACARAGQYETVMQLLNDLMDDPLVDANTYVYNGMLQSLVQGGGRAKSKERLETALNLLQRMQPQSQTMPDTVTFNTLFALCAAVRLQPAEWEYLAKLVHTSDAESLAHGFLDQMTDMRVAKNLATYRQAILAVGACGPTSVHRMLDRALADEPVCYNGETELMNSALAAMSRDGHAEESFVCVSQMVSKGRSVRPNEETLAQLLDCLGHGGKTGLIPQLLRAIDGEDVAREHLQMLHVDSVLNRFPNVTKEIWSRAIRACLVNEDFPTCRQVFDLMHEKGVVTSCDIMRSVAEAYARASVTRSRLANGDDAPLIEAQEHARKASVLVDSFGNPPATLVALVCGACGYAGLFPEARRHLLQLHQSLLARMQISRGSTQPSLSVKNLRRNEGSMLPALHYRLMKSSARHGNVTSALQFCDDIQNLSRIAAKNEGKIEKLDETTQSSRGTFTEGIYSSLSMHLPEWTLLLEAASRSGHWKVCLSTLQFIRPYVGRLHPTPACKTTPPHTLSEYRRISRCLTSAIKCLSIRSQYAWAVRTLEDWIQWSGRRPPIDAVQETIRALSLRGRDKEVIRLAATCLQAPAEDAVDGSSYEMLLYVSAITAVSNEGLYAAADELFLAAIARGCLPFSLKASKIDDTPCVVLDLHRMNRAVARSSVRIALQKHMYEIRGNSRASACDIVIVTGRGLGSALKLRPILRPEVQRLLQEEFYPPLNTYSVPGNMGALRISCTDVKAWVAHQDAAKAAHMLTLASALKSLSSVERLRSILSHSKQKNHT
ncbi:hypothetical protein MPSEU_000128300 [Mayamaea pseudoterrestris]|nr:hypothetical protein MPSEU_000128300 [Mayamaea pseudoterrestris]